VNGPPKPLFMHVDMDAFFVSVELLDRPELRGRPVAVGGTGPRSVVAAASYEARVDGVRSAMGMSEALRRCPDLLVLEGRRERYLEVSQEVFGILRDVTPLVEPLSIDEAFCDIGGVLRSNGTPRQIARALRATIAEQVGLTASVGIAPRKFVAKIASEHAKPRADRSGPLPGRGVVIVDEADLTAFLDPLPIRALWGVGPRTAERLERLGTRRVADVRALPLGALTSAVGRAAGEHLHRLSHGIDDRGVVVDQTARSISQETTFSFDRYDRDELRSELVWMAERVGSQLRHSGLGARTVQLKVRTPDFATISRSHTADVPTDLTERILERGQALLADVDLTAGVRLLGLGVANLVDADQVQPELVFDLEQTDSTAPRRADRAGVDRALDAVRERFGERSIQRGARGRRGQEHLG
jgi:DNA polymerase-4